MKKFMRLTVLLAVFVLVVAACSPSDSADTTEPSDEPTTTEASEPTTTEAGDTTTSGASGEPSGDPIIIGAAVDLSQNMAPFNGPALTASQIMVDRINAAGGVLGRPLQLISADATVDAELNKSTAIDMISQGAEILIVTCDFDFAAPAIQEALAANILAVAPCIGTDRMGPNGLGAEGDIAFSFGNQAQDEGAVLAEFAMDQGWENALIVKDNLLVYFQDVVDAFDVRFTENGGTVVATEEYVGFDGTIGNVVTSVANADKDVIVISTAFDDLPAFVFGLRSLGDETPIVCSWACDGTYWYQEGTPLNNFYYNTFVSVFGDDPDPEVDEFVQDMIDAGNQPFTGGFLGGAQMIEALANGIEATGGTDADALAGYLATLDNESLIMGEITLNTDNHTVFGRPHRIMVVTDSTPAFLETRVATSPADIR